MKASEHIKIIGDSLSHENVTKTKTRSAGRALMGIMTRVKELESKLIETASELGCMIDMENARLEQNISSADLDDPDYFDHQTVHEAMKLAEAT
tara:strand:- start:581 stop:862 length:282 start_codon:yes stop_codon:yes gene_type:complete